MIGLVIVMWCYFESVGLCSCLSVLEARNSEWFLKKVFNWDVSDSKELCPVAYGNWAPIEQQ